MDTTQLLNSLALGELSNLALADTGEIQFDKVPTIINYINDGLASLFTRFILCEKEVIIREYNHITNYHLLSRFAYSQHPHPDAPFPYIMDLDAEEFEEDVIKVLSVFNNLQRKIPLNDPGQPASVFTPQPNIIQVPLPQEGSVLSVSYQARHRKVLETELDRELDLPWFLEGALKSFVAYKVFSHMNTQESTAKAAEHMGNFESVCINAVQQDLVNQAQSDTSPRFEMRGWK